MAQPLYSTSFNISQFSGINQSGDGYNMNMQFAREMENVNIEGGSFQPMREGRRLEQTLTNPIGTLAYLHRRWGDNAGTLLVAISNGRVYTKALDGSDDWVQRYPELVTTTSNSVTTTTENGTPLAVNDCDWVTYEISLYLDFSDEQAYVKGQRIRKPGTVYKCTTAIATAEAWDADHWTEVSGADADLYPPYDVTKTYALNDMVSNPVTKNYRALDDIEAGDWDATDWDELTGTDPVDILLFSNATDGMFCLYGDTLDVVPVETPKKFGVLARYNERVWGAGIKDDPDMLVYSVPYDPFDWSQNDEFPEDGAGDIQQPTWDGDSFVGLKQLGNVLLAIKRNSIWRISGTNPSEFVMQQMYGGGTVSENTVAVYKDQVYMLGEYGLMRYDGSGAFPFQQDAVRLLMKRVKHEVDTKSYMEYVPYKGYLIGEKRLHLGQPYRCIQTIPGPSGDDPGEAWTPAHWELIEGDPVRHTCAGMWNGVYCLALPLDGNDRCNAILQYDTTMRAFSLRTGVSVDSFLQINERLFYTSADYPGEVIEMDDNYGSVKFLKWTSGFQDLGMKSSIKSAFIVYLMVESEVPIELRMSVETEKKKKEKIFRTKPGKMTRVQLNTHGRIFRLGIESYTSAPFLIAGGIKVDLELDPD